MTLKVDDIDSNENSVLDSVKNISIVYVLAREDKADIVKFGSTRVSAKSRAVNYTDGGWHVVNEIEVPTMLQFYVERYAHDFLKKKGYCLPPEVTSGTANEIFMCTSEFAVEAVESAYSHIFDQVEKMFSRNIEVEVRPYQQTIKDQKIRIANLESKLNSQSKMANEIKEIIDFYDLNLNKGKKDFVRFAGALHAVYEKYK